MKPFPDFVTHEANRVAQTPDPSVQGFVFNGEKDVQIVFWQCKKGGKSPRHSHDFWEYALVVEGTFKGEVDGKEILLNAGDECLIPPGKFHSGTYSKDYRAIDAFSQKRVERADF